MTDLPVVIVGGGFSGTLLAVNLVRHGARVVLIERHADALAKGLAYGTRASEHLLNVRASNMSAFPDDPAHFLRWMGFSGQEQANRFVPRLAYGQYCHDLMMRALSEAESRFVIVAGRAVDLRDAGTRPVVMLDDGREITGRAVVLALGHLPPRLPHLLAPLPRDRALADPWSPQAIAGLDPDAPLLLLGTGLTAVDVVLSLDRAGHRGPVLSLSRRGLRPNGHAESGPDVRTIDCPVERGSALVGAVRRRAAAVGWRAAIDELRPHTRTLWQAHDTTAQTRFLRHLRPWWDVHRHRLATSVAARIAAIEAEGRLTFRAGRLVSAEVDGDQVVVGWRPRGTDRIETWRGARVINCTGPEGDIAQCHEPLLTRLIAQGAARADPHRLGLDVDPSWHVRDSTGIAQPNVFAVGPLTKGAAWEIIAVPDIRHQVWDLARQIGRC